MKRKGIIAALVMATLLTGCSSGGNTSGGMGPFGNNQAQSTPAVSTPAPAPAVSAPAQSAPAVSSAPAPAQSVPEVSSAPASSSAPEESKPENNSAPADFYRLFDAEYKECHSSSRVPRCIVNTREDVNTLDGGYIFYDSEGKLVFSTYISYNRNSKIYSFDVNTKNLETIKEGPDFSYEIRYTNDTILTGVVDTVRSIEISSYDLKGNPLNENVYFHKMNSAKVLDGFVYDDYVYDPAIYDVSLNKLETEAAEATVDLGHGKTKTETFNPVKNSSVIGYKGMLYGSGSIEGKTCYFSLDPQELKWKQEPEDSLVTRLYGTTEWVGKYRKSGINSYQIYTVTDIETGEVFEMPEGFEFDNYFGGDGTISLENGVWVKKQYDNSGKLNKIELGKESNSTSGKLYQLDDKYYIVKDKTGIYLRTYEKGEDEEWEIIGF